MKCPKGINESVLHAMDLISNVQDLKEDLLESKDPELRSKIKIDNKPFFATGTATGTASALSNNLLLHKQNQ